MRSPLQPFWIIQVPLRAVFRWVIIVTALLCEFSVVVQQVFRFDAPDNVQDLCCLRHDDSPQTPPQPRCLLTESNGTLRISVVSSAVSRALTYQCPHIREDFVELQPTTTCANQA